MPLLRKILLVLVFMVLTALTQVGGVELILMWLCSQMVVRKLKPSRFKMALIASVCTAIHVLCVWFIIPTCAAPFGRMPLPRESEFVKSANWFTILTYRNYLNKEHHAALNEIANSVQNQTGILDYQLIYLDANLPFLDGFPLVPHLSHDDGNKIDLAFMYSKNGNYSFKLPSYFGYGNCAQPREGEPNTTEFCESNGYWHYAILEQCAINCNPELKADTKLNSILVKNITSHREVRRIFLEPHLTQRWNAEHPKVRFHGCHSVRHDDHIHLEFNAP